MLNTLARVGDWAYFSARAVLAAVRALVRPNDWLRPLYAAVVG